MLSSVNTDRRSLLWFLGTFVVLATAAYLPIYRAGSLNALGGLALPFIMWTPGLAALFTCLVVHQSLRPMGLGLGLKGVAWSLCFLILPPFYTLLIYLPLHELGVVELGARNLRFSYLAVLPMSLVYATGEELGWRGFLAPIAARQFGFVRGQVAVGVVWFLFHVPAICFAGYGGSALFLFGTMIFFISVVSLSVLLGLSRLASGSVWPAALLHASHNTFFLHWFDPMKKGPGADWLIGEQGLLLAVVLFVCAVFSALAVVRKNRSSR